MIFQSALSNSIWGILVFIFFFNGTVRAMLKNEKITAENKLDEDEPTSECALKSIQLLRIYDDGGESLPDFYVASKDVPDMQMSIHTKEDTEEETRSRSLSKFKTRPNSRSGSRSKSRSQSRSRARSTSSSRSRSTSTSRTSSKSGASGRSLVYSRYSFNSFIPGWEVKKMPEIIIDLRNHKISKEEASHSSSYASIAEINPNSTNSDTESFYSLPESVSEIIEKYGAPNKKSDQPGHHQRLNRRGLNKRTSEKFNVESLEAAEKGQLGPRPFSCELGSQRGLTVSHGSNQGSPPRTLGSGVRENNSNNIDTDKSFGRSSVIRHRTFSSSMCVDSNNNNLSQQGNTCAIVADSEVDSLCSNDVNFETLSILSVSCNVDEHMKFPGKHPTTNDKSNEVELELAERFYTISGGFHGPPFSGRNNNQDFENQSTMQSLLQISNKVEAPGFLSRAGFLKKTIQRLVQYDTISRTYESKHLDQQQAALKIFPFALYSAVANVRDKNLIATWTCVDICRKYLALDSLAVHTIKDVFYYSGTLKNTLVIAFQGALSITTLVGYGMKEQMSLMAPGEVIKVHSRYYYRFLAIKDKFLENIQETLAANPAINKVVFTGHSVGGVFAQIAGIHLKGLPKFTNDSNFKVYTFAFGPLKAFSTAPGDVESLQKVKHFLIRMAGDLAPDFLTEDESLLFGSFRTLGVNILVHNMRFYRIARILAAFYGEQEVKNKVREELKPGYKPLLVKGTSRSLSEHYNFMETIDFFRSGNKKPFVQPMTILQTFHSGYKFIKFIFVNSVRIVNYYGFYSSAVGLYEYINGVAQRI